MRVDKYELKNWGEIPLKNYIIMYYMVMVLRGGEWCPASQLKSYGEIMRFERVCEETKEVMLEYDIPFYYFDEVYDILIDTDIDRAMKRISFNEIVKYLKERATRDCYNKSVDDPEFVEDCVYDWLFYLREYSYYIRVVLGKGTNHLCRSKKFYFPKDVFDITYKHQNARHNIFLKYMQEHHSESMFDEELEIR